VARDERVDDHHPGARVSERPGEVGTDEAEASGDEAAASGERFEQFLVQRADQPR